MTDIITVDNQSSIVIGIDLGTRNSCISTWKNKKLEVICDGYGNRTLPSVVAFLNTTKLVGSNALILKEVSPENIIYDIKRLIGKKITDKTIEQVKSLVTYEIGGDENNEILIYTSNTKKAVYKPVEICSFILKQLKSMADKRYGESITKVVITVPAYFNDFQRQATLDAAKIAGLDVLKIINEPTAAAIAYGLGSSSSNWNNEDGGNVIVYDFGAGTLDVSLMNISNGVFRTLSVGGNFNLGGEDIDNLLINYVFSVFKKQHNLTNLDVSKLSFLKLKNAVENAKKILSVSKKTSIIIDNFVENIRLCVVLTRNELETVCLPLFNLCIKPLVDVLDSANLTKDDINSVILVGGSTKIPKIQKLILSFFKDTPIKSLTMSMNPDEVVSAGAAMYGYIMTNNDDPFTSNVVLLDITPLSLGVETLQKKMTVVIPRNTVIPTSRVKIFTTDTDYQDCVTIKIYEGERKLTRDNYHVDTVELCGFEKGPRGYPTIKITFKIDINGMLQVTAHEKKSLVENSIVINSTYGSGRLSQNEINLLIDEAKENETQDLIYSKKVESIYNIRSICNAIIVNINDPEFNIESSEKNKITNEINLVVEWLKEYDKYTTDVLIQKDEYLQKKYLPLIFCSNKKNTEFVNTTVKSNVADVYGDDTDVEINDNVRLDITSKYDINNENVKEFKKNIISLGDQILDSVNAAYCTIYEKDREYLKEYINSVFIWVYTTSSTSSTEYLAKIDEINTVTQETIGKYNDSFFADSDTYYQEQLKSLCTTLQISLDSNSFSLEKNDESKLEHLINQTIVWLEGTDHNENCCLEKINLINSYCNSLYNKQTGNDSISNLCKINNNTDTNCISENKLDNNVDINKFNDYTPEKTKVEIDNKICENIDNLLNNLPTKVINSEKSIFLKIDINKLNTKKSLKYKN